MRKLLSLLTLLTLLSLPAAAQVASSVRVQKESPEALTGAVVATINGTQRTIAPNAWNAWLIEGGRAVVYSGTDGAGGYEDEGQSLWRYNVAAGTRTKLVTEVFAITRVSEVFSRTGRRALLVRMADGGLGAPHLAVVHPTRGQVWRERIARPIAIRNGRIGVGLYTPEAFEPTATPRRILYLDINQLLNRPASRYSPVGMR
jgi:hypothetical protein